MTGQSYSHKQWVRWGRDAAGEGCGVRPCYLTIRVMKTVDVNGRFNARSYEIPKVYFMCEYDEEGCVW